MSIDFFNVEEAASFLRLPVSTMYQLVHQRRIPYRKHGRRLVFTEEDLKFYSDSTKIDSLKY